MDEGEIMQFEISKDTMIGLAVSGLGVGALVWLAQKAFGTPTCLDSEGNLVSTPIWKPCLYGALAGMGGWFMASQFQASPTANKAVDKMADFAPMMFQQMASSAPQTIMSLAGLDPSIFANQ